jgi:gliding motility associated protien GldN
MTTRVTIFLVQGFFMFTAQAQITGPGSAPAQTATAPYEVDIYNRETNTTRKVVPWPHLREADVMWSKKITRIIDVREKQNQCMQWPKHPLNVILYRAIKEKKLIPYLNDSLTSILSEDEFLRRGSDTEIVDKPISPDDPEITEPDTIINIFDPLSIKKFRVLEEWIFDKKLSTMYVRIIAIAPIYKPKVAGIELGEQDLCVLKYVRKPEDFDPNDVREILVNHEIFNRQNSVRITFDDWFEQRLFSSYIIKEDNQYDNRIKDYEEFKDDKVAAMLEAERIKYQLFEMEHDLWEY